MRQPHARERLLAHHVLHDEDDASETKSPSVAVIWMKLV